MSPDERQQRLLVGDEDPFGPRGEGDSSFAEPIPPEVVKHFAGRWVLLRNTEGGRVVVKDADKLPDLLAHSERVEGDVTAFVRDPTRQYA